MDDCIFCKIVRGEIPSSKIHEDDDVMVFLDIMPMMKGHALVIPKTHMSNIFEAPDESLAKLIAAIKKTCRAVKEAVNADGVNVIQSNGKAAAQIVEHLHFHIVPRKEGDRIKFEVPRDQYAEGEMDNYRDQISKAFER